MAKGSASKVSRIRRCKHALYYSDMLELRRSAISIAPQRGTILHSCLQALYSGKDWTTVIANMEIDFDKLFDEERAEWAELPNELYRIMRGYVLAYRTADSKITTLATEVEFEFDIGQGHTYCGFIDWIYEDAQGVWICDHKTVKTLPSESDLYMDIQTIMYFDACRKDPKLVALLAGKKLAGVVFNHIRTKSPREPLVLKSGGISKAACDTDVATYFDCVRKAGLDVKDYEEMLDKLKHNVFFRRIKLPVSERTLDIIRGEIITSLYEYDNLKYAFEKKEKESKHLFPRTMLKQRCSWDCEYSKLCFAELAGMNTDNIIAEDYEPRVARKEEEITDGE